MSGDVRDWGARMEGRGSEVVREELPAPSAELVLIRVAIQAYMASAHEKPRRRARAFLTAASSILADEQSVSELLPIRPATAHARVMASRRAAVAIWRQMLPVFIAKLPRET